MPPLGRAAEQLDRYRDLAAPGGHIVLEDPDTASWRFNPPAPSLQRLIGLILQAFRSAGGDFDAGRHEVGQLQRLGLAPQVRAEVLALPPGHPYQRLPLQFASSLETRLLDLVTKDELASIRAGAETELADTGRWSTTFTLIQTWATVP